MTRTAATRPGSAYPIRAVARLTGLSLDTLRAWERRYAAVVPQRGERGRLYTEQDVARLRQLGALVGRGHAIGSIAHLGERDLAGLLARSDELSAAAPGVVAAASLDAIVAALDGYDVASLERALNRYALLLPPRELVFSVIVPLLAEIGSRWADGTLRPAQEHLVSGAIRSVLGGMLRAATRHGATPTLVFATPTGERHELGLLSGALLAAAQGFGVVYLGADLPPADIWHAASASRAATVVLSLTMTGLVARETLDALAAPPAGLEVWVGGPAASDLTALAGEAAQHLTGLDALDARLALHAR